MPTPAPTPAHLREQQRLAGTRPHYLTDDEFEAQFKPIQNSLDAGHGASYCGWMFETYGSELDFVAKAMKEGTHGVWTILDSDGVLSIVDGMHRVNRFGYILTEIKPEAGRCYEVVDGEAVVFKVTYLLPSDTDAGEPQFLTYCCLAMHEDDAYRQFEAEYPNAISAFAELVPEEGDDVDDEGDDGDEPGRNADRF